MKSTALLFVTTVAIVPLAAIAAGFSFDHEFLGLAQFGQQFSSTSLTEIKQFNPPRNPFDGVVELAYPVSVGCESLGNLTPCSVYCIANLFFWFALLWMSIQLIGTSSLQQHAARIACGRSAGGLVNASRALTDMPALKLALNAVWLIRQKLTNPLLAAVIRLLFGSVEENEYSFV